MQDGGLSTLARTPFHARTGCGGFHRKRPSGGAAKGIPRVRMLPFHVVERTRPPSTGTTRAAADPLPPIVRSISKATRAPWSDRVGRGMDQALALTQPFARPENPHSARPMLT